GRATLAQRCCPARVAESVAQLGPLPGDLQLWAALRELQVAAPWRRGGRWGPGFVIPVIAIFQARSCQGPKFCSGELDFGFEKPCVDPIHRDRRRHAALVLRLLDVRAIDLVGDPSEVIGEIGFFSVSKKCGRQRLAGDAQPAIFWFGAPAGARQATGAAVELPDRANLWIASADIADAFYN
ncbi:unnamed protein product, partial [Prorocentrum cordatum]